MFERYTEPARRVLFFARYEASQLGSIFIETEHLLLGLIHEGKGLTSRIFARSHLSLETIRTEIVGRTAFREKVATSVEIPFSAGTKRMLQFAAEEADRLLHSYVGAEHLLLGILREEGSVAASILMEKGMRISAVREDIVQLLHEKQEDDEPVVVNRRRQRSAGPVEPESESSSFLEVRISPAAGTGSSMTGGPGSWLAVCDLRTLLSTIYDYPMARIELPSWLDKGERYHFAMRYSPDQTKEVRYQLLVAWIGAHFRITVTPESRPMEVYVLTAPQGLSAQASKVGEGSGGISFGSMGFSIVQGRNGPPISESQFAFMSAAIANIAASNATLAEFAQLLEPGLDRFVVDETGVTGRYDLQVTGEARTVDEFRDRLRDQLGLHFTPARRNVAMLVVRGND